MKRLTRLLAVPAVVASAAACDIEFTQPGIGGPAFLDVSLTLTDDGGESLDAQAFLYPGEDRSGGLRTVADDSLRILGSVLTPERFDPRLGVYRYSSHWSAAPETVGSPIRVQAPRIDGIEGAPPHITFALVRRSGPDTIVVSRRDTIELHVVVDSAFRSSAYGNWDLTIKGAEAGKELLRLRAWTTPPDVIAVPLDWLPDTVQTDFSAELNASLSWQASNGAGEYEIEADARSVLRWVVRVEED